jgi:hypothetical protein
MQVQEFSLATVKEMYDRAGMIPQMRKNKAVLAKDLTECKNYLTQYFFPLKSGGHLHLTENKFVFYDDKGIRSSFFNRMSDDIVNWYFKETTTLYTTISNLHSPRIEGSKINLCQGLLHKSKPYNEYKEETKVKVNIMLEYINEVICGYDKESYIFILKWISFMCKGKKNDVVLYFKSLEGVGKSTLWEFIIEFVLGIKICIKANTDPLRTSNNKILMGMLLVVFEELPTFSSNEWCAISGKLKDMTTSKTTIYCDKYEKSFESDNINNYVINTNVEALKNAEGRRYFIPPISTKRINDHKYFKNIRDNCFNNEVGEAFFSYMMEIDTTNYNAQKDMPTTVNKLNTIASRLDNVYLFLKECYVLHRKDIKCKSTTLFKEYQQHCYDNERKAIGKHEFFNKLREINIEYKPSNGSLKYKVSYLLLQQIADKFKWIHETDEYIEKHNLTDINDGYVEPIDDDIITFYDFTQSKKYQLMLKIFKTKN